MKMYGVKLYDKAFCTSQNLDLMQKCGLNTVFLGRGALVPAFTEELSIRGMFWNIVEPVFLIDEGESCNPAVLDDSSPAVDDWVRFACPSDKAHLDHVRKRITDDIDRFCPPGVSLDFIRFFQYWEMTDPHASLSDIRRSCYCQKCVAEASAFEDEGAWRKNVVERTASSLRALIGGKDEDIRVGIHCVPWTGSLFGGARMSVLGQDVSALKSIGDYLTPMVYHHMMHMDVSYVRALVEDMASEGCPSVVPSIQVREYYRTDPMGVSEFKKALENALESPSDGVLIYRWEDLATDAKRLDVLRSCLDG